MKIAHNDDLVYNGEEAKDVGQRSCAKGNVRSVLRTPYVHHTVYI